MAGTPSGSRAGTAQPPGSNDESCLLCDKKDKYMTKFKNWKRREKDFIVHHYGKTLAGNSNVSKKCLLEAKRHHTKTSYNPEQLPASYSGRKLFNLLSQITDVYTHTAWLQRS